MFGPDAAAVEGTASATHISASAHAPVAHISASAHAPAGQANFTALEAAGLDALAYEIHSLAGEKSLSAV